MKLYVEGDVSKYEVTVKNGTYSIINESTGQELVTPEGIWPDPETAARMAIAYLDSLDGPVQVQQEIRSFSRRSIPRVA